jgi:hypothetical protein
MGKEFHVAASPPPTPIPLNGSAGEENMFAAAYYFAGEVQPLVIRILYYAESRLKRANASVG